MAVAVEVTDAVAVLPRAERGRRRLRGGSLGSPPASKMVLVYLSLIAIGVLYNLRCTSMDESERAGGSQPCQPSALMHPTVRTRKKSEEQPRQVQLGTKIKIGTTVTTKRLPTNPEIEARFENYVGICRTYGKMREFGKK